MFFIAIDLRVRAVVLCHHVRSPKAFSLHAEIRFEVLHSVARLCKVFFKSGIRCIPIESILDRLRGSPLWAFLKSTSEQRNERMRGEGPGPGVKPAFGASFLFISSKSCRIGRYRRRCRCRWRGCIGWAAKESAICPLFRLLRVRLAAPFCSK